MMTVAARREFARLPTRMLADVLEGCMGEIDGAVDGTLEPAFAGLRDASPLRHYVDMIAFYSDVRMLLAQRAEAGDDGARAVLAKHSGWAPRGLQ